MDRSVQLKSEKAGKKREVRLSAQSKSEDIERGIYEIKREIITGVINRANGQ